MSAACSPPGVRRRAARTASSRGDGQHAALAGAVERIQAQQITGGGDRFVDRDGRFIQLDGKRAVLDKFVQRGGDAAAGRIAHQADGSGGKRRG